MEINKVYNADCKEHMKTMESESVDIIYTDVPYNMGTKYTIDSKGHYCVKGKGSDFMNRWEIGDGRWWNEFFELAYRILKPGGYFVTHNIDRQSDLWTYYGRRNGFYPTQKLYWLFVDNFPKGVDTALMVDNHLGVERTKTGMRNGAQSESTGQYGNWGKTSIMSNLKDNKDSKMVGQDYLKGKMSQFEGTKATSELAKKYDGYKHGIAPCKQVMEEILVLWKEPQINATRCIVKFEEDIINKGASNIHPPIFNIGGTRVPSKPKGGKKLPDRWTPQLVIDSRIVQKIVEEYKHEDASNLTEPLPKISFNDAEMVQYSYTKKASVDEKEFGLDDLDTKTVNRKRDDIAEPTGLNADPKFAPVERKNSHPTSKPIALGEWVLRLFKIPDPSRMVVFDPFTGSGSILISAQNLGMQYIGTELGEEYHKIAEERLKAYKQKEEDKSMNLFGNAI
jgi:site-specific DNA-methyltransferase (adenine-specific)